MQVKGSKTRKSCYSALSFGDRAQSLSQREPLCPQTLKSMQESFPNLKLCINHPDYRETPLSECQVNKPLLPSVKNINKKMRHFCFCCCCHDQGTTIRGHVFFLSSRVVHQKGKNGNLRFSRYGWAAADLWFSPWPWEHRELRCLLQSLMSVTSQNLWVFKPASKSSEILLITRRVSASSCLQDVMKELHKFPRFLAGPAHGGLTCFWALMMK